MQAKATSLQRPSQRRTRIPDLCKELTKAKRIRATKTLGVELWMLSSCFLLQNLLNDQKIHGMSRASSEVKGQDCREPLKEEEYKKLRDILQQRDNEISILSDVIRNIFCWPEPGDT